MYVARERGAGQSPVPAPGTDFARLIRDESGFARIREALSPLLTDDFQSLMAFPGHTRTHAGLEGYRKNWLIGATTFVFRGAKIARIEEYADRAKALEAAGVAEDALQRVIASGPER